MDRRLVFCKFGGSVITDKMRSETARPVALSRLAGEVATALDKRPGLRLVLGHGSGSFGHVAAREHGTRYGVRSESDWQGFVHVASVAAHLGQIVTDALLEAGVPVWSLPPSASARCRGGELVSMNVSPVADGLSHGLVPLVRGDVSLDADLGGTIVSTEEVFVYLAHKLAPSRLVLVGNLDGVFRGDPLHDPGARHIPHISASNWEEVRGQLGASNAPDVTGGMLTKVEQMVKLAQELPGLVIHLVSGERPGALETALIGPAQRVGGTTICWHGSE
ncbi:isopentenyl phosphate kinase [Chloroflexota bacterium]